MDPAASGQTEQEEARGPLEAPEEAPPESTGSTVAAAKEELPLDAPYPDDAGVAGELCEEDEAAAPVAAVAEEPRDERPPPAESSEAGFQAALEQLEEALGAGFATLSNAFEDKLAYDRFKEEQITRLHGELQEHKKDLLARTAWPLIQGLIRLHDDLGRTTEALAAKPDEQLTPERFFKTLEGFGDDLVLLLEHHGVRPFEAPGEVFDPQRQTAARRVETADPERVGRVAERLRPGFEQGAALLQKERVAVYVAAPAAPESSEAQPGTADLPPNPES